MNVEIDGTLVPLESDQIIGKGCEETIFLASFKGQQIAMEVYHQPIVCQKVLLVLSLHQS